MFIEQKKFISRNACIYQKDFVTLQPILKTKVLTANDTAF